MDLPNDVVLGKQGNYIHLPSDVELSEGFYRHIPCNERLMFPFTKGPLHSLFCPKCGKHFVYFQSSGGGIIKPGKLDECACNKCLGIED